MKFGNCSLTLEANWTPSCRLLQIRVYDSYANLWDVSDIRIKNCEMWVILGPKLWDVDDTGTKIVRWY